MPRRAATITQADVARTIRAAQQTGATTVEVVTKDGTRIIVRLTESTATLAPEQEIVL